MRELAADEYGPLPATAGTEQAEKVADAYARVLTMRQKIISETDVPWLSGPGKLTIYHVFKESVGRQTHVTRKISATLGAIPALRSVLKRRILDAEAFKAYRELEFWDRGTPLDKKFAGSGMHQALLSSLK